MITLQVVAGGLLLIGSGLVFRMLIALDRPSFGAAAPRRLPELIVSSRPRPATTLAQRRAA